jgi:hypothetical protein
VNKKELLKHFWIALFIGFVFRMFSAHFVFGPQALDDYLNQLIPSFKFAETGVHLLPAWRSPLIVWILSAVLQIVKWFGILSPVGQVQSVGVFLGILSLSSMIGCYYFFSAIDEIEIGKVALYFTALHGLMPFVSTRIFLESISMGPLTLGVGLLIYSVFKDKRHLLIAGFCFIGFATLIRFQVGLIYVTAVGWIFVFHRKWWREVVWTSLAIAAVNAGIDLVDHRAAFSTLFAYFAVNKDVSSYGSEPWYSTWLAWFAIGLFPFSAPLLKKVKQLGQKGFREVLCFVLFFVLVHSLISHKEERFMYPVFGISIWLWAALWVYSKEEKSFRRFVRPVVITLNSMILCVGCFVNTQVGEIGVLAKVSRMSSHVLYIDRESLVGQGEMWEFFVRSGAKLIKQPAPVTTEQISDLIRAKEYEAVAVITSQSDLLQELKTLNSNHSHPDIQCTKINEESSLIDALIYKMNPRRNERRRPTWYTICADGEWFKAHQTEIGKL